MDVDWTAMFAPERFLLEIFLRGTIMSTVLFSILRFFIKRQSGVIGIADLLVIVLIADTAQNAMANEYKSIPGRHEKAGGTAGLVVRTYSPSLTA